MKFIILLTLLTTLNVSAFVYSQDTKLNLSLQDKSLREVIKSIENQSNFRFFFSDDYLDLNKKVTVFAQNKGINEILPDLLEQGKVTYKVMENNVIVITPVVKQVNSISGTVTDALNGELLIGVSIAIKGSTKGVVSDANGKFTIDVAPGETLVVSYVGYLGQEIVVSGQKILNIQLAQDVKQLDEVVVIGYGTVKKKDLTGSVASIKSDDITKTASSNAMQSMQAKLPGVDIQQTDGQAGAGLDIKLRGQRSLLASNSPLILVDGVEYGSNIDINPSDIESMDVLKDASSTAIYGTKGANGVIIITTKRGKAGKTIVNFSAYTSVNKPVNIPKIMYGGREVQRYIDAGNYTADLASGNWGTSNLTPTDVLKMSLADGTTELSIYGDGSCTNWADIILKNGQTQNYELSVSGGNEKTVYNLSLGLMNEGGLMKNDELNRYNGKISIDHKINKMFKAGSSILFTYKDQDARNASVFSQSMKMTSLTHPYLTDGSINITPNPHYPAHVNPLMDEIPGNYQNNRVSSRFFGNTYVEITPLKNLIFKSMFALDKSNGRNGLYQDYQSVGRFQAPGTTFMSNESENTTKYTWDNTLNYSTKFGKHDISVLAGQSATQSVYEEALASGPAGQEHYYTSAFYDLSKITTVTPPTSTYTKTRMLSFFGRLNYKFNERYLLTASFRADGSSTIATGHKWGYFPSVAGAWRVSEESFLTEQKAWLSNLKFRVSWGVSGNAAVPAYETLSALSKTNVYYYLNGSSIVGNIPSKFGNVNLKWETTAALNFGLDFGLLNNRISGTIDYYISKTNDLLYYKILPASSVYTSVIDNIGNTEGKGIEIALNTLIVKSKDFSWDINWSYYHYTDKATYLGDDITKTISGTGGYVVGQPLSIYYDYKALGCWGVGEYATYLAAWQARHPGSVASYSAVAGYGNPGTIKIKDTNDDGKIDETDKAVFTREPTAIMGMNNTFTYKNLSLSVQVYARLGGSIQYGLNSLVTYDNSNWGKLDYWTYTNQDAKFPSPGAASTAYTPYSTSLLYEKADYIKIKDITLSYSLPKSLLGKVGIDQVKFYGSLKNYFTNSSISNYDPERGGSISFPLAKQMVFGMNLQF